MRIGLGYDLHRLAEGRPLILGGLVIPHDRGEDGHSDGDVLAHAVIDALLGAAGLGDIGEHFPPSENQWRGASSLDLLRRVMDLVRRAGLAPVNLDCTVVLERPRLSGYKTAIAESLASCLGLPASRVSVKAKTKEGVDAVGQGLAVEAHAAVLLE